MRLHGSTANVSTSWDATNTQRTVSLPNSLVDGSYSLEIDVYDVSSTLQATITHDFLIGDPTTWDWATHSWRETNPSDEHIAQKFL